VFVIFILFLSTNLWPSADLWLLLFILVASSLHHKIRGTRSDSGLLCF
jgi:hypothetical protein